VIKYVAIDPGETTGVAEFDADGKVLGMHQFKVKELYEYFERLYDTPPQVVIFEEYRIFAHKKDSHINSKVPTIQIIGAIKYFAWRCKATAVEQPSQHKPFGYKYGGFNPPKDHSKSHGPDALAHGFYYLVTNRVIGVKPVGSTQEARSPQKAD
jgi:hypothetical protein